MPAIMEAAVGFIKLRVHDLLTTKLPSTGLEPHYGATCDKSTPGKETNHGIMLLYNVNGIRDAIPLGAPKVYSATSTEITGGKAIDLANQVLDMLLSFSSVQSQL